jgi:formaldehyde-activating enzyme involved in methanogenesis
MRPEPNTTALGGVATGIMKAMEAEIVAAHDSADVMVVPKEYISIHASEGTQIYQIEGIAQALRRAAVEDCSFSEMGLPWAAMPVRRSPVSCQPA